MKCVKLMLDDATYAKILLVSNKEKRHPGNYIRSKVTELVDSLPTEPTPDKPSFIELLNKAKQG